MDEIEVKIMLQKARVALSFEWYKRSEHCEKIMNKINEKKTCILLTFAL
jgi:hypothetical protein